MTCRWSAGADGGAAGDADRPAPLADRVPVAPVRDVAEGEAALGVGPRDLAAGAVVPERARRLRVPEPALVGVAAVAGDADSERPVRGRAPRQQGGERAADPAGGVRHDIRVP